MTTHWDQLELRAIEAIRRAAYFSALLFVGRGRYLRRECATVAAAMAAGRELEADPRACTRRAVIYAVTLEGRLPDHRGAFRKALQVAAGTVKPTAEWGD